MSEQGRGYGGRGARASVWHDRLSRSDWRQASDFRGIPLGNPQGGGASAPSSIFAPAPGSALMARRFEHASAAAPATLNMRAFDAHFRQPLMRFFSRRVATASEAEDLTQDVFVRLLRREGELREPTADAYVFQIATNLLRDRARRDRSHLAGHHVSIDTSDSAAGACTSADLGADCVLAAQEELRMALATLDELGERCRDIFLLYRVEGMKQKEIAALYGLSVRMVEKYIVKAAAHLARRYERA